MSKKALMILFLAILSIGLTTACSSKLVSNNIAQATESDYRYVIKVANKYGFINRKGEEVIKPQYDYAEDFLDGLAEVCNNIDKNGNQKCRYIDINGKVVNKQKNVIPNLSEFSEVGEFHEGLAYACKSITDNQKQCGYINEKGKIIIPLQYDYASDFSEGLAVVSKLDKNENRLLNKSGYIDKKGNFVLKGNYFYEFSNGLASDISCSKYFDKTGKVIVDIGNLGDSSIDGVCSYFNDGLLLIQLHNHYFGYVNKKGELVIKTNARTNEDYSPLALTFSDGLAYIELNNKWGFIDKTGKVVIKPRFIRNFDGSIFEDMKFKNGLARVKEKGKYGYIDKTGKFVWSHKVTN